MVVGPEFVKVGDETLTVKLVAAVVTDAMPVPVPVKVALGSVIVLVAGPERTTFPKIDKEGVATTVLVPPQLNTPVVEV